MFDFAPVANTALRKCTMFPASKGKEGKEAFTGKASKGKEATGKGKEDCC